MFSFFNDVLRTERKSRFYNHTFVNKGVFSSMEKVKGNGIFILERGPPLVLSYVPKVEKRLDKWENIITPNRWKTILMIWSEKVGKGLYGENFPSG